MTYIDSYEWPPAENQEIMYRTYKTNNIRNTNKSSILYNEDFPPETTLQNKEHKITIKIKQACCSWHNQENIYTQIDISNMWSLEMGHCF